MIPQIPIEDRAAIWDLPEPGEWLEQYGDTLYRYALVRLRRSHEVEDVVQETLLAALKARWEFEGRSQPLSWLIGILKRKILDRLRAEARNATDAHPDELDAWFNAAGHWRRPPRNWDDPAALAERSEFWTVVRCCAGKLPPLMAEAFTLGRSTTAGQGSNTVAAFRIRGDGSLDFIGTFDSGGVQPDSIGIANGKLYVNNKGDATAVNPGTVAPTILGLTINSDGSLAPIPNSTVTLPVGTVPSQNLISPNGQFLFSDIFGVNTAPESNTLAPFQIEGNGTLNLAPGGNVAGQAPDATTAAPALLGAAANSNLNIVYAGLTGLSEVAVFTYDSTGRLSFVGATAPNDQGGRGPCWTDVSPDGKFLYTGDTGSDSVGVYSLANPLHPVQIQELFLGGPQTPPGSPPGTAREVSAFQVAVDPSGRYVYAISQNTSANGTFQEGNQLHILAVAHDGTLSEPNGPIVLSADTVPGTAHPQGIAVVSGVGERPDHGHKDPEGTKARDSVFVTHAASHSNAALQEAIMGELLQDLLHQKH